MSVTVPHIPQMKKYEHVSSATLKVNKADNEITITLNGELLYFNHHWQDLNFNKNITSSLKDGGNVLVVTIANHSNASNPAEVDFDLSVNTKLENFSRNDNNFRQGVFYQAVIILNK